MIQVALTSIRQHRTDPLVDLLAGLFPLVDKQPDQGILGGTQDFVLAQELFSLGEECTGLFEPTCLVPPIVE